MDEAPKPAEQSIISIINKQKNLELISDKSHKFKISFINEGTYLKIICTCENELKILHSYESNFKLEKIKENKLFYFYESIDEVLSDLFKIIDEKHKELHLLEETNKVILIIPLPLLKVKEIIFPILEVEKNDNQKIKELYNIIDDLNLKIISDNTTIKELNEKINKLTKESQRLIDENKSINEKLNKLINENEIIKKSLAKIEEEKELKKRKKENIKNYIQNLESNIVNSDKLNNLLKKWINPDYIISAKLLYRLSRDGSSYQSYQNKCLNRAPTLTLVHSVDGKKFGGYTTCSFDDSNKEKKDEFSFLFSLDKKKKYCKRNNNYNSIYCRKGKGPDFYHNFELDQEDMSKCYCDAGTGNDYWYLDKRELADNYNDSHVNLKEVEIYYIDIN